MLTFETLREVNLSRCNRWHPGGIEDWSLSDWACAMGGEVGEVCEAVQAVNEAQRRRLPGGDPKADCEADVKRRVDLGRALDSLAGELADLVIYLDLLSARADIDLPKLVKRLGDEAMPLAYAQTTGMSDGAISLARHGGKTLDIVKKLNRHRDGIAGNRVSESTLRTRLCAGLIDTYIATQVVAAWGAIDLAGAVVSKFNAVSERHGFPERLKPETEKR